jgi:uncharacterized membrane protein YkoI
MKTNTIIMSVLLAITATHSRADLPGSREIRLADCPAAVRESITQHSRGGHVEEVGHVRIGSHALYVAEVDLAGGRDLEIHVDASGKLIETREETTLAELPVPVRSATGNLGGSPDDIECHVNDGTTTYHLEIERRGRPDLDVVLAADGQVISQAEEADD